MGAPSYGGPTPILLMYYSHKEMRLLDQSRAIGLSGKAAYKLNAFERKTSCIICSFVKYDIPLPLFYTDIAHETPSSTTVFRHALHRCGLSLQMSHVAWSVCLSACVLVKQICCAKTAEPIQMPNWGAGVTHLGPRNQVLDRSQGPSHNNGQF